MIRHLTPADYRSMPWANGRGVTVEMLRIEAEGALLCRLSRASVVQDGPFSIFPGIERNLTVIGGPGFDLAGAMGTLPARPLVPVAFAGDVAIRAVGVSAPSEDFNVMTARSLGLPRVTVVTSGAKFQGSGTLAIFALGCVHVNDLPMALHDLIVTTADITVHTGGLVIVVSLNLPG